MDAQPVPYTLLSLSKFAKILGINPAHFWGGSAYNLIPQVFPVQPNCSSVWYQYQWQDADRTGRYDIALEIQLAEQEVADFLGYWPAPFFVADKERPYPRPYRREYFGAGGDIRGLAKSVSANYGRIIAGGRRAVSLIDDAVAVVYSDPDGDGFSETATITAATTLTDVNEIKVYQAGRDGDMEWEIRDVRSKTITGGNVVIVVDSWLMIDPALYEVMVNDGGMVAIDISTTGNFVVTVDVYREYVDTTQAAAVFYWENAYVDCATCGGLGCEACGQVTQDGCLRIRNADTGIVVPRPASYDAEDEQWDASSFSGGREPDRVRLWYYAGERSKEYLAGRTTDPMPYSIAQAIAFMAIARLERPLCECGNVESLYSALREDLTANLRDVSYFLAEEARVNPFGTKRGEVLAWRRLRKTTPKIANFAVI